MKRMILPLMATILLVACNKKETADSLDSETPTEQTSNAEPAQNLKGLQEVTDAQLTTKLQTKNDTLYVTNFFATWCPPCIKEIPHFREKLESMKDQPVKFTFVDMDNKTDWDTTVNVFVDEQKIREHVILIDMAALNPTFYSNNFKTWTGETIPFTFFRKGDKTHEVNGMVTEQELNKIITSLQ